VRPSWPRMRAHGATTPMRSGISKRPLSRNTGPKQRCTPNGSASGTRSHAARLSTVAPSPNSPTTTSCGRQRRISTTPVPPSHTFNADFIRRFFKDWRPRLTSSAIAASAKGIQVTSFTTAPFLLTHETNWICDHIKSPRPMFLPPSKG